MATEEWRGGYEDFELHRKVGKGRMFEWQLKKEMGNMGRCCWQFKRGRWKTIRMTIEQRCGGYGVFGLQFKREKEEDI